MPLYIGSIDLSKFAEEQKKGHTAIQKSPKNSRIYGNIKIWVSDTPDQYGNQISIQLNSASKEASEKEGKIYVGNAKMISSGGGDAKPAAQQPAQSSGGDFDPSNLPF